MEHGTCIQGTARDDHMMLSHAHTGLRMIMQDAMCGVNKRNKLNSLQMKQSSFHNNLDGNWQRDVVTSSQFH